CTLARLSVPADLGAIAPSARPTLRVVATAGIGCDPGYGSMSATRRSQAIRLVREPRRESGTECGSTDAHRALLQLDEAAETGLWCMDGGTTRVPWGGGR